MPRTSPAVAATGTDPSTRADDAGAGGQHTPLPWRVFEPSARYPGIECDGESFSVVVWDDPETEHDAIFSCEGVQGRTRQEAQANAAFIVRACNSHYELLEALEAIEAGTYARPIGERWISEDSPSKNDTCIHGVWMDETCEGCLGAHVQKALGKAKGGAS